MAAGVMEIGVLLDPKNVFPEADQLDNYNTDLMQFELWTQKISCTSQLDLRSHLTHRT